MRDVDDTRSDDLDNEGEDLDDIREADEEQDPDNEPYPENDEENYFDDGREMQDYGDDDPDVQESQRPDDMMDVIKEQKLAQLRRKSSIRQPKGTKLMAPDPIQGISNLPKGFRASTLSKNADQGKR